MKEINYFLVLEFRLGDYVLIDINKLDICSSFVGNDIASIDAFTSKFDEEEIKSSIERSNMASVKYLNGSLKIISDIKHNLKVLTKDIFNVIVDFQNSEDALDNNFKNRLFGIYKKIVEQHIQESLELQNSLKKFKNALKSNIKGEIFKIIEELPYAKIRSIYFVIYDECIKRQEENLRKLEKLNDPV